MNNRKKSVDSNSSIQNEAVEEVHTGYLLKSPPPAQIRQQRSWKRRFFVLAKTSDGTHEINYYTNTMRQKAKKTIKASTIISVDAEPRSHSAFDWMIKTFKCSPFEVLLMTVEDPNSKVQREFLLKGESSEDADKWLKALKEVIKTDQPESETKPEITTKSNTTEQNQNPRNNNVTNQPESETKPEITTKSNATEQNPSDNNVTKDENPPSLPPRKLSTCDKETPQEDHCSQSDQSSQSASELYDNVVTLKTLNETTDGYYQEMSPQDSGIEKAEESLLNCVTKLFNNLKTQELPPTPDQNKTQKKSESYTNGEKEISISRQDLNNVIFTEQTGRPCVLDCKTPVSCLFHEGDEILAVNDLLTDTVEEIQTYLKKTNKDEVKLTIRRLPDSLPLNSIISL